MKQGELVDQFKNGNAFLASPAWSAFILLLYMIEAAQQLRNRIPQKGSGKSCRMEASSPSSVPWS